MSVAEPKLPHLGNLIPREEADNRAEPVACRQKPGIARQLIRRASANLLFIFCFAVPVMLTAIYYLFDASSMYISESRFIVRSSVISPRLGVAGSNVGQVSNLVRTNDDTQSVNAYLFSRDAMERLIRENQFLELVSRPEADFLSRFPHFWSGTDHEALFERLSEYIEPTFDTEAGVSTLRVRAFRPEDARAIVLALLSHAEELINKLNDRAKDDAIAYAEEVVGRAEAKVKDVQARIADFAIAS